MPLPGRRCLSCAGVWSVVHFSTSRGAPYAFWHPPPGKMVCLLTAHTRNTHTMYGRLLQATRTSTWRIHGSRRWFLRGIASRSSGDGRTLDVLRLDGHLKGGSRIDSPACLRTT